MLVQYEMQSTTLSSRTVGGFLDAKLTATHALLDETARDNISLGRDVAHVVAQGGTLATALVYVSLPCREQNRYFLLSNQAAARTVSLLGEFALLGHDCL